MAFLATLAAGLATGLDGVEPVLGAILAMNCFANQDGARLNTAGVRGERHFSKTACVATRATGCREIDVLNSIHILSFRGSSVMMADGWIMDVSIGCDSLRFIYGVQYY